MAEPANDSCHAPPPHFVRVRERFVVNRKSRVSYDRTTVYLKDLDSTLGKAYQQDFYDSARQHNQ